jgi:hypothetical protein
MLQRGVVPPVGCRGMTNFGFRVALNVRQNPGPPPIGSGARDKVAPAPHFVAERAGIEGGAGVVGALPTVHLTEKAIPNTGEDAVAEIAHDVFNPAVVATGSKAHGFCHALGGSLATPYECLFGARGRVSKERVASVVINVHVVGVTTTSAASAVRHNITTDVVGFIGPKFGDRGKGFNLNPTSPHCRSVVHPQNTTNFAPLIEIDSGRRIPDAMLFVFGAQPENEQRHDHGEQTVLHRATRQPTGPRRNRTVVVGPRVTAGSPTATIGALVHGPVPDMTRQGPAACGQAAAAGIGGHASQCVLASSVGRGFRSCFAHWTSASEIMYGGSPVPIRRGFTRILACS